MTRDAKKHCDDICSDLSFSSSDSSGSSSGDHHHRRHRRDRRDRRDRRRRIPIGEIIVDCTPVRFETPGQARTILSCPLTQTSICTTTRIVEVQVPTSFGCVLTVPVTETIQLPVTTTVNLAPTLVPIPTIVCPTFIR